jgi:hypothetical protein
MYEHRIDSQGRVISRNGGLIMVHRPDQCDYEGCKGYKMSGSRHCRSHAR